MRKPAKWRPGQGGPYLVLALVFAGVLVAAALGQPSPRTLSGRADAIDGDTLRLAGERVRLLGIDAPELAQSCGPPDAAVACGWAARSTLAALVRKGPLSCTGREKDRYGRLLATCTLDGLDLGAQIVAAGHAVADGRYGAEEAAARSARAGIWSGPFQRPDDWRREAEGGGEGARLPGWLQRLL